MLWPGMPAGLVCLLLVMSPLYAAQPGVDEIVIDVRSFAEFVAGHYPGAQNIPFDVIACRIETVTSDKHQPIALYCRSGACSALAKKALEAELPIMAGLRIWYPVK